MTRDRRVNARFVGIADMVEAPSTAVVIDVMRAFTVTAWAFAQGAEKIILAGSLEEALALKAGHPEWVTLKDGPPAPGFDLRSSCRREAVTMSRSWSPEVADEPMRIWPALNTTLEGQLPVLRPIGAAS